jgi:DegV family protein with EDD domain
MDTLKYLQKGGRIGLVSSVIGGILNLKPIISCNEDGVYYTVCKIRGSKHGIEKLISEVAKHCQGKKVWVAILNGGANDEAKRIKPIVLDSLENGEFILDKQINPSLAVHTGPGLIGICVLEV